MSFRYPLVLFLLPLILWLLYRALQKRSTRKVLYFPLAHRGLALSARQKISIWLPFALRALGMVCAVIALARPQTSSSQSLHLSEGIDIMLSLDVSESMLIQDLGGGNSRLYHAKETLHSFVDGRKDDRIGFSVFSGEAISLCPPTLDYDFLHSAINLADVNQLRDGTAIGDGLAIAVNRIKDSTAKSRIVILATDGDNNMGSIAPLTVGDIAAGYGIRVYTIAMGSDGESRVPGYQVPSSINPTLLMKIADMTNGKFYRATDAGALKRVFGDIDKLERSKVEKKERVLWTEHFMIFVMIALACLLIDLILRSTIYRVLPE